MSWASWEKAAEDGPEALARKGCVLFLFVVLPIGVALAIVGYALSWFGDAAKVAKDEFGPRAALRKYEWFKDAAAALDAKLADIKVYEGRFARLKADHAGKARGEWPREDREQANLWESEVAGIKSSFNRLAAEFNAQHAKANWAFADIGNVPAGGRLLPREFRSYEEK